MPLTVGAPNPNCIAACAETCSFLIELAWAVLLCLLCRVYFGLFLEREAEVARE